MGLTEASATVPVSKSKKFSVIFWSGGVLVAIFLCMGAVAAPKSGLFTSKCKSRQSEAKTHLSGLFTAEKSFFGEFGFFSTDLVSVDWQPDGSPLYAYGFAAPSSSAKTDPRLTDLDPTRRTTLEPRVVDQGSYQVTKISTFNGRLLGDEDFQRLAYKSSATSSGFLAFAIGDIDGDGKAESLDVWTVDENKQLTNVSNDCTD